MSTLYRHLPSTDVLLDVLTREPDLAPLPRTLLKDAANDFLDFLRAAIREETVREEEELTLAALTPELLARVRRVARPHFRRVLNATGVVVHTNLGRSLLAPAAVAAVAEANERYSNLEFDLGTGQRGSRYSHVEAILTKVTGAEAALVVNNNAAAVLLTLNTLCQGKEVVVSRGQLVEIGGSFRIPDVMARSGAKLVEVGATNRTHPRDYENAITEETAALLKVHTSNYRMIGFTKEVPLEELVQLGRARGLLVIEDLGSGSFMDFTPYGLGHEPTVREAVASGADVITFSGDKVLGGPQAGLIVGRREAIERIKKNPMNRALRIDKMTLAALEATLRLYLDPEKARAEIPTLRMITRAGEELAQDAARLTEVLETALAGRATIGLTPSFSRVGGGSFPERDLPTTLVSVAPTDKTLHAETLRDRLLSTDPPLIGRIEADRFCLDPRTLQADEYGLAGEVLRAALGD